MALAMRIPVHEAADGFRSKSPSAERFSQARESAAFSAGKDERHLALCGLHDIDSLSFVAGNTPYPETKEEALRALEFRLSSFSAPILRQLSADPSSPIVKGLAGEILIRRG
ncbi:MAG TPA: hypothetical protein VLD37_01155 [Candidatus Bilamarchaeum sp.]|nr:hypothetical protein [Candidatus Bilamarchaeum sp.]